MTLPDFIQLLVTVAVGAGATLITLRVAVGKMEVRIQAVDDRLAKSEQALAAGLNGFQHEVSVLNKTITELTATVAKQSVGYDSIDSIFNRLGEVEKKVAVLESKRR